MTRRGRARPDPTAGVAARDRVSSLYPHARWSRGATGTWTCALWASPVPPVDQVRPVISDLERRRPVSVGQHGQLLHDPACPDPHPIANPALELVPLAGRWLKLRLEVPPAPALPKLWCLDPPLTRAGLPEFPHLNQDDSACVLYAPDGTWDPRCGDGPAEYLAQAMFWCFKAEVWLATRHGRPHGAWIGPDTTGDPRDDLEQVAPDGPCVCGSGRRFQGCCRPFLAAQAAELKRCGVARVRPGTGRHIGALLAAAPRRRPDGPPFPS